MEERRVTEPIRIYGAELIFKNFEGREDDYNQKGNRNFGVLIDDENAKILEQDGWYIRYLKPRPDDPEQHRQAWLKVNVKYEGAKIPPIACLINHRGRKRLTEETIDQLDWTRAKNVDLTVRPYNYPARPGKPAGVSAYLQSIYVTILEDEMEEKYSDLPDLDEED